MRSREDPLYVERNNSAIVRTWPCGRGANCRATSWSGRRRGSARVRPLPPGLPNSYSSLKGQCPGHFLREASLTPPTRSVPRPPVRARATSASRHSGPVECWVRPRGRGRGRALSCPLPCLQQRALRLAHTHTFAGWLGRHEWSPRRRVNRTAGMGPCSCRLWQIFGFRRAQLFVPVWALQRG